MAPTPKKHHDNEHLREKMKQNFKSAPVEKAESQIQDALNRGEFENLPGSGQPLKLDDNPFTQPTALATDLLKQNGFSLPWIEQKRDIETAVAQAEKKLLLVWERFDGTERSKAKWQQAKEEFSVTISQINKKILTFNLKAPAPQLHIHAINIDDRIRSIQLSLK